jgi:hypothetical protein
MWGANAKFIVTSHLPPIIYSVCITSNLTILVQDHGKNQENPPSTSRLYQLKGFSSPHAATCPSPCRFQLPRARRPPGYLTQDQRGEHSRLLIFTVAAAKATKPADDSGDDDDDDDEDDVQSIGKKGNDGGDDKQGVKEGSVLAAAKAAKPGCDDSKDDDDNKEEDKDNKEVQKGGNKRGDKDDEPSASMGTGSSSSLSDEVVM